jgi:hypothetical protein
MLNAKLADPVRPNPALQNSAQQNSARQNAPPPMDIGVMTGLVLGTPEFQRR